MPIENKDNVAIKHPLPSFANVYKLYLLLLIKTSRFSMMTAHSFTRESQWHISRLDSTYNTYDCRRFLQTQEKWQATMRKKSLSLQN